MLAKQELKMNMNHDIAFYSIDGRLTEEPDGKRYDWGTMIECFKKTGKALTEEEMESYRIK